MTQTEALRLALQELELEEAQTHYPSRALVNAITAIKAALEAKDEPVAWRTFDGEGGYDYRTYDMNENYANEWNERNPKHNGWVEPLYTTPPQRTWVGLTDEELAELSASGLALWSLWRAIEAKLKEKNK